MTSLSVKQLSEQLQVSERTIYRMVDRGDLPGRKVGGQWRFWKSEVDYWLDLRMTRLALPDLQEMNLQVRDGVGPLGSVLTEANALIPLSPGTRREVIHAFVDAISLPDRVDRGLLADRICEREDARPTGTAEGIAFLHTARWQPRTLIGVDLVAVGRLSEPTNFDAIDGAATDILLLLLAGDDRRHLAMLAGAARLSRVPGFLEGIRAAQTGREVQDLVSRTEAALFSETP